MAALLYLLLKLARGTDTFDYDTEVFCLILAFEGPGYLNAIRLWWLNGRR